MVQRVIVEQTNDVTSPQIAIDDVTGVITARGTPINSGVSGTFATPVGLPTYTVATLPAGVAGQLAYASNGRKVGEGAGLGTGVVVYFSNGSWRVFSTDAAVAS